jgi:hypothetical protein
MSSRTPEGYAYPRLNTTALEQLFSTWAIWPLRGAHQVSKGPLENDGKLGLNSDFWVGHRNFIVWIKYFEFKIESKFPFSPASPAAQTAKLYFIAFPHLMWLNLVSVAWLTHICCQKHVTACMLWRAMFLACHWHTATGHSNTCSVHQAQGTHWI